MYPVDIPANAGLIQTFVTFSKICGDAFVNAGNWLEQGTYVLKLLLLKLQATLKRLKYA